MCTFTINCVHDVTTIIFILYNNQQGQSQKGWVASLLYQYFEQKWKQRLFTKKNLSVLSENKEICHK